MNDMTAAADDGGAGRSGAGFDRRISLATSVHAAPGTYALLLGAGVSIGAGVKIGWDIVTDLVSRAAAAQQPDDDQAGAQAAADPEAWWAAHGEGPLSYSALLDKVAPDPAARQAVLRSYFEPKPDEAGEIAAVAPGAAHRAIAQLVLRGSIKVILTTNFDRLTERALEEVGISPEVIHGPGEFDSATPLDHTRVTVVKLHGDWKDPHLRNTADELAEYPEPQQRFLDRVLDEYGLIVCGWSADHDEALVTSLEKVRVRRYPLFWSHLGPLGENARSLVAKHKATTIAGMTADAFFEDLLSRLRALDHMSEPPLSRDMSVARLKRTLLDPQRRIELHDLIAESVGQVIASATPECYPLTLKEISYEESVRRYRVDMDTVMHLIATGAFHDDGTHTAHWVKTVQRLSTPRRFTAAPSEELEKLRHYPALLATWTAGVAAVLARREELLYPLMTEPQWRSHYGNQVLLPPAVYLSPYRLLDHELISEFCNTGAGNPVRPWKFPQSRLIREQAREALAGLEPDDEVYEAACDRLEFLATMISFDVAPENFTSALWHGEFIIHGVGGLSERIKAEIAPGWPLLEAGAFRGEVDRAEKAHSFVLEWVSRVPDF